jgi:HAMP domain-containing protein
MAVAVGGGWLLAKYSMRPVTRVIQAARQITATNLSRRLPAYPAQDEIGALVETVNDLIARIDMVFPHRAFSQMWRTSCARR